ncbi:exonuclease domain-containing protein [Terrimonas alba]|uniref:exonuclease domain-containing protein n=1 Tax=Terrimonas alba TaxID=3349636 RepID=UPI0035F2A9CC
MYAIVDIETTGGYASANGITEISIRVFDGSRVVQKFETLVNPLHSIPYYIQSMTGITNEMVKDAPLFSDVAEQVYEILHDKIFVAHNVNFDYSFVKSHLAASNFALNTKKLCTIRLSRKIFPGFNSYSLGNLCHSLDIPINDRHRAGGDAEATVKVFQLLLQNDKEKLIEKSLLRNSKEQVLPPNVPKEHFDQLPYSPGVYYFHNEKGKVIYVGKAKNIRYRVNSHFSNNSESRQKQNFLKHTYGISYQPCATELMAHILESTEIKKIWPAFNYSQKNAERVYGIFLYEDQKGYYRLAIEKNKKQLRPVHTFHYLVDGHSILRRMIREYNLCPKLCFLQTTHSHCEGIEENYCYGACELKEKPAEYNNRVLKAIESFADQPTFAIIDNGLSAEDQSCILVCEGKFYGMGYIPSDIQVTEPEMLKDLLTPYKENLFIRNLVNGYAARFPEKVRLFSRVIVQSSH